MVDLFIVLCMFTYVYQRVTLPFNGDDQIIHCHGDDDWRLLPSFAIGRPQRAAAAANLPTTYRAAVPDASSSVVFMCFPQYDV